MENTSECPGDTVMTPEPRSNDENFGKAQVVGTRLVLIFRGVPGLGKSTVGNSLRDKLCENGILSVALEQDQFLDRKNSSRLCFELFESYLLRSDISVIIQQRNNANESQYIHYENLANQFGWTSIHLVPSDLNELTILHCFKSVMVRKGHSTFEMLSMPQRIAVTSNFYKWLKFDETIPKELFSIKWFAARNYDIHDPAGELEALMNQIISALEVDDTTIDDIDACSSHLCPGRRTIDEIVSDLYVAVINRLDLKL